MPDSSTSRNDDLLDKLGYSPDGIAQRRDDLLALIRHAAPEVISDHQIDLDRLKMLLGSETFAPSEHYELNWAGKAAARREIQQTTSHTLRPSSENPAQAAHMLIEGENLEVLRVLQKSYYGKIKMIYIDPPYNTGNDSFVYPDDYTETLSEYQRRTGEKNEAGFLNKQSLWKKNSKESGQYHSAWLSMVYPRLYLSRNLLREDGVIFISIDDHEAANLKLLCDEVFGAENFVAQLIARTIGGRQDSQFYADAHEYILCYARKTDCFIAGREPKEATGYNKTDATNGRRYKTQLLRKWGDSSLRRDRPNLYYPIPDPDGNDHYPMIDEGTEGRWRWERDTMLQGIAEGLVEWAQPNGKWIAYEKLYEPLEGEELTKPYNTIIESAGSGSKDIQTLFAGKFFDYPKATGLIQQLLKMGNVKGEDIILDFFAGSGTTAQAVMELNLEDGGSRQCICVQLPEPLKETSDAYKAGYRTIAELTRARIDKAIAKLKTEHADKTADLACAHFTLTPSNFNIWRGDVADVAALREQLELLQQTESKTDPETTTDKHTRLLAELLLKQGHGALGVHAISKPLHVAEVTIHRVTRADGRQMWLCFEPYTEALKESIIAEKPAQVILLNSCFTGDKADELLSNLTLELSGHEIALMIL